MCSYVGDTEGQLRQIAFIMAGLLALSNQIKTLMWNECVREAVRDVRLLNDLLTKLLC